jgi:CheY-like chemotaxis protein
MVDRQQFAEQVREALYHLYDFERLRELQLGQWLYAATDQSGRHSLSHILVDAIETLKPPSASPPDTPDWRVYQILFYRFVQCMTTQEVANQIGIGERHYRRHQAQAIHRLANLLWEQAVAAQGSIPTPTSQRAATPETRADMPADLAWLQGEASLQRADLHETLAGVIQVLGHLAAGRGVRLALAAPPELPRLRIHPQALRQVLVNILSYVIDRAPGGHVVLNAHRIEQTVQLQITASPVNRPAPDGSDRDEALAISQQLLEMVGGRIETRSTPTGDYVVTVTAPSARRLPVLIVEDNRDTAELFARYLAGSRYRPVVVHSGREALARVSEISPRAIVLDVMMPEQDGWDTLILLHTHPDMASIPVVVTTILGERELALSLGAAGFLHKPVRQEQLLAVLDQVVQRAPDPPVA